MFQSARLKLTLWYLTIIMIITICFSAVIYHVLTLEVKRFDRLQRVRFQRQLGELDPFNGTPGVAVPLPQFEPDLLSEVERRLLWSLVFIDTGILLAAGGFGYLLAGRTLQPIQDMVNDQNRFITDSSHELRTPLTSLKTALEVSLRDTHLSLTDARTVMSESVDEVNKLQSLTDELLELAQYQEPVSQATFKKNSLGNIGKEAISRVKRLAVKKQISITNQIRDVRFEADANGIRDLLVILLENAVKYSQPGKHIVLKSQATKTVIKIKVIDQGIGVSADDLPHIFDRFYRTDQARSKLEASGYGLGLSIAKKIVETHNGTLTVTSQLKKGTTFTITLPLKQTTS